MSTELIFVLCIVALVFILAYTAYGKGGQSDINEHAVDSRTDVPPGAGRSTGVSDPPEPTEADNFNAQRGVK